MKARSYQFPIAVTVALEVACLSCDMGTLRSSLKAIPYTQILNYRAEYLVSTWGDKVKPNSPYRPTSVQTTPSSSSSTGSPGESTGGS